MKQIRRIGTQISLPTMVLLQAMAFVASGCGKATETGPLKRVMYRSHAGTPDASGWYSADSTGGHFKIKFPAPYNDFRVSGTDDNGRKEDTSTVGMTTRDNTKYSATLLEKETPVDDKYFDDVLGRFKSQGTLQNSRRLDVQGHPALEIEAGNKTRMSLMRIVPVETKVYILMAEFDSARENALKGELKTFLNSLELPSRDGTKK